MVLIERQSHPFLLPLHSPHAAPTFDAEVAVSRIHGQWFTDEAVLLDLLQRTVTVDIYDDCGRAFYTSATLNSQCDASDVTLAIEDRCGNPATTTIPVLFDPTPSTNKMVVANQLVDSKRGTDEEAATGRNNRGGDTHTHTHIYMVIP